MKYNNEVILEKQKSGKPLAFVFFWGHTLTSKKMTKACLSQWFDCYFEVDGVRYHTTEQYMMAQKALLFEDRDTYLQIMNSAHPSEYKALGRQVRNFSSALWNARKREIVLRGNVAKFSQNPSLLAYLLGTEDRVLVEASPYDSVWGVKLGADDGKINNPEKWRGENLLGYILMETRDILRNEEAILS